MANSVQHNYRIQQYDHFNRVVMSIVFFVCLTLVLVYQLFSLQTVAGRRLYNRSPDNQLASLCKGGAISTIETALSYKHTSIHLMYKTMREQLCMPL